MIHPKARQLPITLGFILFLISCESTETEKKTITKEHFALIGTWQEEDTLENTVWTFDLHEVKWKGFTHFYHVSNDSLIISGLVYHILEQSDSTIQLLKLNGKQCTLVRKD